MTSQYPAAWPTPPPDLSMLMGRLLERSEAIADRLESIDRRLQDGDTRMDRMAERMVAMEAAKGIDLPALERTIKGLLPYLIVAAALAGTGSLDVALKMLAALAGKPL